LNDESEGIHNEVVIVKSEVYFLYLFFYSVEDVYDDFGFAAVWIVRWVKTFPRNRLP
jgi:hypothetical protein